MKKIVILLLALGGLVVQAQTNAPAPAQPPQQIEIQSEHGRFDGVKRQMIYQDKVFVTDGKSQLFCEKLIVDVPEGGGQPTNIVALTNVIVLAVDQKGQTNRVTSDKAVYSHWVEGAVTNSLITFTGGNPSPKAENAQFTIYGEPLTMDVVTRQFGGEHYRMIYKQSTNSAAGTNASPFSILK